MRSKLLPLLALCVWTVTASAGTLIVNDDGPRDHATIQSAVDAAQPGDTVLIQPGTYQETILIENKTDLTLRGTHRDSARVLRVLEKDAWYIIIVRDSDQVTVEELTIDGSTAKAR